MFFLCSLSLILDISARGHASQRAFNTFVEPKTVLSWQNADTTRATEINAEMEIMRKEILRESNKLV